jgi:hypothetical protein
MAKIEYCIAKTNEMVSGDSTFLLLPFAIAAGRFIFAAQFSERSVRLGVRTPDFHSGNTGSIPVRTTSPERPRISRSFLLIILLKSLKRWIASFSRAGGSTLAIFDNQIFIFESWLHERIAIAFNFISTYFLQSMLISYLHWLDFLSAG